ncbi:hypothetical protein [Algibacter sp. PT7-4]|uniref:hypothetical protein n=1 Tax=Algibacter ulvanivorans TaxID=3400999 RepID=UPI003AAB7719
MKFNKLTVNKAGDALVTAGEAAVGFAGSNVGVKALDSLVNNKWASKGIVAAIGILGVVAVPNKHIQAVSAGVVAKQVYDGAKELVEDHASDVAVLQDAFELSPSSSGTGIQPEKAMAALRASMAGRAMGNPAAFQLGNPTESNIFQLG